MDMECSNVLLHKSKIDSMNKVREKLWKDIYTIPGVISLLENIIKFDFPQCSITEDLSKMSIIINTNDDSRILSNKEADYKVLNIMIQFFQTLYNNKHIDEDTYYRCIMNPYLLYIITLNTQGIITLKL